MAIVLDAADQALQIPQFSAASDIQPAEGYGEERAGGEEGQQKRGQRTVFHISGGDCSQFGGWLSNGFFGGILALFLPFQEVWKKRTCLF